MKLYNKLDVDQLITRAGMSGGPILDIEGRVVGIHGRAEADEIYGEETETFASANASRTGLNLGIAIATFIDLVSQAGLDLSTLKTTASTPTPTESSLSPANSSSGIVPTRPQVIRNSNDTFNSVCAGREIV